MIRNKLATGSFAVAALFLAAAAPTPLNIKSGMSIEQRATACIGWSARVGQVLSDEMRGGYDTAGASVAFARSIPVVHRVSVQLHADGCESEPVNVVDVLPNEKHRGSAMIDRQSRNGNQFPMYALVEIESVVGRDVRTFILARKMVTGVEVDSTSGPI